MCVRVCVCQCSHVTSARMLTHRECFSNICQPSLSAHHTISVSLLLPNNFVVVWKYSKTSRLKLTSGIQLYVFLAYTLVELLHFVHCYTGQRWLGIMVL